MASRQRDPGPIEYRKTRVQRRAERAARTAERPARKRRGEGFLGVLIVLGILGVPITAGLFAVPIRTSVGNLACAATACSAGGMTTAGWLVVILPPLVVATILLTWRRAGRVGRTALVAAGILVCVPAMTFIPGRGKTFDSVLRSVGAGADQFATGLRWGLLGLLATGVLVFGAVKSAQRLGRPARPISAVVAVVAMLAALGVAWGRATPTYLTAADVFPEPGFTSAGDTLSRGGTADQRGCAGIFADDALLNRARCVRTLRVTFTTDDSDAVVDFRAVLYLNRDAARAVRNGLPDGVLPVDVDGSVRTVYSVSNSWLLLGVVGHADGRQIETEDRGWLLWALKCVAYRFMSVQSGFSVEPSPQDGIGPRNS